MMAAAGGTLLLPAVTALTLGIVGKDRFPKQQGRNQAFNHLGILLAAGGISLGTALVRAGHRLLGARRAWRCWRSLAALTTPGHC